MNLCISYYNSKPQRENRDKEGEKMAESAFRLVPDLEVCWPNASIAMNESACETRPDVDYIPYLDLMLPIPLAAVLVAVQYLIAV